MEDLKYQIIQKGVTQLLDEAKVPQRIHLQVIQALAERMKAHTADMAEHQDLIKRHKQELDTHESIFTTHQNQLTEWDSRVQDFLSKDWTGEKGESGMDGSDGISPSIDEIVTKLIPHIPQPKDGADGKDGFVAEVDKEEIVDALLKRLKDEKLLDLTHIKGAQEFMKNGIKYRVEELMHGSGSSTGGKTAKTIDLSSLCDGSNKVFNIGAFTTILSLIGSDAPIVYRPAVDFTQASPSITLLTLNAPSLGSTLIATYV